LIQELLAHVSIGLEPDLSSKKALQLTLEGFFASAIVFRQRLANTLN
jgi:hypothetical protein